METWEDLKKQREEVIRKEFAGGGREGGLQVTAPAALPVAQFPGVDVGKVRVNPSTEQEFKAPSMGQIPVGGGYITLAGGETKPIDTSAAVTMGPGTSQLRLPTIQEQKAAETPIFLGRMGRSPLSAIVPVTPTAPAEDYPSRNKRLFSEVEADKKKARDEFGLYR
jgi:hypothetical protein